MSTLLKSTDMESTYEKKHLLHLLKLLRIIIITVCCTSSSLQSGHQRYSQRHLCRETHLGKVLDGLPREDEGNIGSQTEQRVESLGLIHSRDLQYTSHCEG
jgi:hypothetical protein